MAIRKIWFALGLVVALLALQAPRAAGTSAVTGAQTIAPQHAIVHQIRQIAPWTQAGS